MDIINYRNKTQIGPCVHCPVHPPIYIIKQIAIRSFPYPWCTMFLITFCGRFTCLFIHFFFAYNFSCCFAAADFNAAVEDIAHIQRLYSERNVG